MGVAVTHSEDFFRLPCLLELGFEIYPQEKQIFLSKYFNFFLVFLKEVFFIDVYFLFMLFKTKSKIC